jgi:hypothetical protein
MRDNLGTASPPGGRKVLSTQGHGFLAEHNRPATIREMERNRIARLLIEPL